MQCLLNLADAFRRSGALMTENRLTSLTIYLNNSQLEKLAILAKSDNPFEVEAYANELFTDELLKRWLLYVQEHLTIED